MRYTNKNFSFENKKSLVSKVVERLNNEMFSYEYSHSSAGADEAILYLENSTFTEEEVVKVLNEFKEDFRENIKFISVSLENYIRLALDMVIDSLSLEKLRNSDINLSESVQFKIY